MIKSSGFVSLLLFNSFNCDNKNTLFHKHLIAGQSFSFAISQDCNICACSSRSRMSCYEQVIRYYEKIVVQVKECYCSAKQIHHRWIFSWKWNSNEQMLKQMKFIISFLIQLEKGSTVWKALWLSQWWLVCMASVGLLLCALEYIHSPQSILSPDLSPESKVQAWYHIRARILYRGR